MVSDPLDAFIGNHFREIIVEEHDKSKVRKVILSHGKMAVDLLSYQNDHPSDELLIVRIEQLYPFPDEEIKDLLESIENLDEVRFVQEEPKNMGAYSAILPKILDILPANVKRSYVGRPVSSSPAEGDAETYKRIQRNIIENAMKVQEDK